jgi:hypothetical protein
MENIRLKCRLTGRILDVKKICANVSLTPKNSRYETSFYIDSDIYNIYCTPHCIYYAVKQDKIS